jgi:hypothetical protein
MFGKFKQFFIRPLALGLTPEELVYDLMLARDGTAGSGRYNRSSLQEQS